MAEREMRLGVARRVFTRLSALRPGRIRQRSKGAGGDEYERVRRLSTTQKLLLVGGGVASAGVFVACGPGEEPPQLPHRDALPGASAECLGVTPNDGVISGQLSDGRRWSVVLDSARNEAARGKLSPATEAALCEVQAGSLVDLRARLAKIDSGGDENYFLAAGDLVAQAEAAVILAQDDRGDARTDPGAAAAALAPLFSDAADAKTDPQRLRAVFLELLKQAPQLAARGEAIADRTPSQDAAHIAQGVGGDDDLREKHPGVSFGGEESPVLTELTTPKDEQQIENAAAFVALSEEASVASREALQSLALAANPTWVLDHPQTEPTAAMTASVEKALLSGASFQQVRADADRAYRAQPGVAEAHVKSLVSSLVGPERIALHREAMTVAADAWRHGKSEAQIEKVTQARITEVADRHVKPLVADLFFPRAGLESGYDRMVSIVRPLWIDRQSRDQIRSAVFTDWNRHAPKHDESRVGFGDSTVNRYTAELLTRAQVLSASKGGPSSFELSQGSYNTSVDESAGTHSGGGAFDMRVGNWSEAERHIVVTALREAGFAAWYRVPADGFDPHIHGIAIRDSSASAEAKDQVRSYFAGRNGLANDGPDRDFAASGRPVPAWA